MDGKTKAIIAHITLIGWIIAFVLNGQEKDEYASYYIRQMLGLMLVGMVFGFVGGFILSFIPFIGGLASSIIWLGFLVFWILSLIGAASGEIKPLPIVGEHFQNWFSGI